MSSPTAGPAISMRMGLCLFHGVLRTHQGSDLLVKLIRGMQIGVQDNPLFPPMAPHHSLTCGLDALGPFPIEGSCCPEMNCRLPPGHDTVKGLPKGKPRTWSQLQGLQLPPASPSVPPPYPNRVSFRVFRSRMRARAAAVTRAVSTPRTTGTQDVRLWGAPRRPVGDRGRKQHELA